ncbi:MAG TPA: hypothetical protein VL120_05390, partial [Solirubrobacteraceae bacterium]|nr:hypothetical protein [Solirubrobacteraceae bacterium]
MSTANPLRDALDDLDASAIEPQRVMVLDEAEQSALLRALDYAASLDDAPAYTRLFFRIGAGDEYYNSQHEFAALEVRKKRLEEEIGRIKRRKADLLETVLDALAEAGARTMREQITDRLLLRKDDVRLAYADPDWSSQQKAIAKETAGDVFQQLGEPFASMLKQ